MSEVVTVRVHSSLSKDLPYLLGNAREAPVASHPIQGIPVGLFISDIVGRVKVNDHLLITVLQIPVYDVDAVEKLGVIQRAGAVLGQARNVIQNPESPLVFVGSENDILIWQCPLPQYRIRVVVKELAIKSRSPVEHQEIQVDPLVP